MLAQSSDSINKTIEYMFMGINMFWAQLRFISAPAIRQGLKWALRRTLNIFMAKKINCSITVIILEGIEKIKTAKKKKNNNKVVWGIILSPTLYELQKTLRWLPRFDWQLTSYNYLILTFHWFISAGKFSVKCATMPNKVIMLYTLLPSSVSY